MPNLIPFYVDLTAHEGERLAAVLNAYGPHWDPEQIMAVEAEAHRLLYSQLDSDQLAHFDKLVAEGVLPDLLRWSQ